MIKPFFKVKPTKKIKDYARFIIEPLEQGYGQTLGNALRRCLLASIPGAAITKIKIDGVRHRFSTLAGMKEDMIELILNIKQIRAVYKGEKEAKLTLDVKGPREVKASDIKTPAEVKIINKTLKLAKLADKKATIKMELWIKSGFGYSLARERKTSTLGIIPIDAIFTPITKVNYKVESTRVGRRTDFDRLILEIWTDGTIKPKKALEETAEILVGFFKQVYSPVFEKKEEPEEKKEENEALKLTVEELNLPTRITNALRRGGYPTVKALSQAPREDLNKVKNLGVKSIKIIADKLKEKEVSLKE